MSPASHSLVSPVLVTGLTDTRVQGFLVRVLRENHVSVFVSCEGTVEPGFVCEGSVTATVFSLIVPCSKKVMLC